MSDYVSVQQAEAVVKADRELQKQFRKACMNGDLHEMEALIAIGFDPHDGDKETALEYACRYGVLVLCTLTLSHFHDLRCMCVFCLNSRLSVFFAN